MEHDTYSGLLFKTLFFKAAATRIAAYCSFAFLMSGIADDLKGTAIGSAAYIAYFEALLLNARFMNRNMSTDTQPEQIAP